MDFVVDASVAACWLLPDEQHDVAEAAFARLADASAIAPALWWFEIRNIFVISERRSRISEVQTGKALRLLQTLPITLDALADGQALLDLARRHRLTVYDAAYLELAQRRDLPLATLDGDLIAAAKASGVKLLGRPS